MTPTDDPDEGRLERQLAFARELDRLKSVERMTVLLDERRRENSAEHSWHLAVMALALAEHADEELDLLRVLELVLVHDVVEIDAGDTYAYAEHDRRAKEAAERAAAERIFGLLPADQAERLLARWEEFEAAESPEARFARALDRFQPLMHNIETDGATWRENAVAVGQVRRRVRAIADGSARLWARTRVWLDRAVARGWLRP